MLGLFSEEKEVQGGDGRVDEEDSSKDEVKRASQG